MDRKKDNELIFKFLHNLPDKDLKGQAIKCPEINYHKHWAALMPVVEKLSTYDFYWNDAGDELSAALRSIDINSIWEETVCLIKHPNCHSKPAEQVTIESSAA